MASGTALACPRGMALAAVMEADGEGRLNVLKTLREDRAGGAFMVRLLLFGSQFTTLVP
jgi:hypothetical protein